MNIEEFISLVKERPILYNTLHPLYKDKTEKAVAWKEIATELQISNDLAKSKWRNLKDCYAKHLKRSPKYTKWQWMKPMEFMRKHLNNCPTSSIPEDEQDGETDDVAEPSAVDMQCDQSSSDLLDPLVRSREETPIRTHRLCHAIMTTPNTHTSTERNPQYFKAKKRNNHDAIELIFLAYAKTVKTFSVRRQAEIKLKIAKLMMEEEIAHLEESQ